MTKNTCPEFAWCDENLDWNIPALQVPAFLLELRAEIDRIEAHVASFVASAHPLIRNTEPGEPDLAGRGGGL